VGFFVFVTIEESKMENPAQRMFKHTLYNPQFEHDACGIGFVTRIDGTPSHDILTMALQAVANLEHRGAVAADAKSGDGAGVLTQIPRAFLLRELQKQGITVNAETLALGMLFLSHDEQIFQQSQKLIKNVLQERGIPVLAWRAVPFKAEAIGEYARSTLPKICQIILECPGGMDEETFEVELYIARKQIERAAAQQQLKLYIPSLSARTVVYKGMLTGSQVREFYPDLQDPTYITSIAVYHQRYSTNTFPSWELAQPFRMLSHNGEINTVYGNEAWMRARESTLRFPGHDDLPLPIIDSSSSDSGRLDNVLELLVEAGRDIRHAMAMLTPEAWEKIPDLDPAWRAFYQYHSCLMEPWDGPAALTFSDGRVVGMTLDRNGLRPARYLVTDDGLVISASEMGALVIDDARIVHKGKLGPGQMIAVDTREGRLYTNEEIKDWLSKLQPYDVWTKQNLRLLEEEVKKHLPTMELEPAPGSDISLTALQMAFGYTSEDLNVVIKPMFRDGQEPVGSMGDDTPIAVLSQLELGRPFFHYFKQRFAEVTNPPIDSLREEQVMSLSIALGQRYNILEETPEHTHLLRLNSPVLNDVQLAAIRHLDDATFSVDSISVLMHVGEDLQSALKRIRSESEDAANRGINILILSDRGVDEGHLAVPMMMAISTVHHHLVQGGLRSRLSLLAESAEVREVHHLACLIGYGAEAVNPYLALAVVREMAADMREVANRTAGRASTEPSQPDENPLSWTIVQEAEQHFIHALDKGLLKIMSKMGISTIDSYCGAQIFEAVGLSRELVEDCFVGTPARYGDLGYERVLKDLQMRHSRAFGDTLDLSKPAAQILPHPGMYKFRKDGEYHAFSPQVVHALQKAVKGDDAINGDFNEGYKRYRVYADMVQKRPPTEPRDLLEFLPAGEAISIDEVEPISSIVRRFSSAAMSHGSTSLEAHETLSIAMNRLGALSNSGEGGEAPHRYKDERNNKIKQVASARFGVTPAYLASASELQIKMAQGSKPGEGGQLPGHKVNAEIAAIRHTVPGVSLISPPPHHDIYSIEDLAQLIYDLKQVNSDAYVSVKLVAEAGVGTVAAGVAKGYADVIQISGYNGGTGASPLSSIKNAGEPWELGLAETQQTLVLNNMRDRVRLRADGGMKTGRDVVVAALLGADEFSFGTAALVAEGCIMARACHSNTCPVGIATQRGDLRAKFPGKPEMVMSFFMYIAHEVREILASLGLRTVEEAVGRTDLLRQKNVSLATDLMDLTEMLGASEVVGKRPIRHMGKRNPMPTEAETLNEKLLRDANATLNGRGPVTLSYDIRNSDRSVGAKLSGTIGQVFGDPGLPTGSIKVNLKGSAGQSFGAFNAPGLHFNLVGEANDYVGKGMAGGSIVIHPSSRARYAWHENVIIGNTVLYGATGGELFAAGRAGERFAVRNSGATAVVEGVGDHGCEYMTGGTVVVIGQVGRNFGAGMTGGNAFVLDEDNVLEQRYNGQLVQLVRLSEEDEAIVQKLLRRHLELTGSPRASEILSHWDVYSQRFWHVVPREAAARASSSSEEEEAEETTKKPGKRVAA
jgi:glutamate synthase (ferredoxin)